MAREYARVKVTIWADDDFRKLSPAAQHLYFMLLSSPTLNMAGIADWRPARMAKMSKGLTAKRLRSAADELSGHHIVVDEDTEEVLVRSFIRHDGILKSPNLTRAMVKAYAAAGSDTLRQAIVAEVHRAAREDSEASGLKEAKTILCEPDPNQNRTLPNEFEPESNPSKSVQNEFEPISPIHQPSTINHQPSRASDPDDFAAFYDLYPKKVGKGQAAKAHKAALKKADARTILEGLRRHLPVWEHTERQFIPNPATWLNGERWSDEVDTTPAANPLAHIPSVEELQARRGF